MRDQDHGPRRTVVGAVIIDVEAAGGARVLAARRTKPTALAGRWEFPGGKVEPGESPEAALVRELEEELGARIEVGAEVSDDGRPWPISEVYELRLFVARLVGPQPVPGADHDEVRWLGADEVRDVAWLDSDDQALDAVVKVLVGAHGSSAQ